MLDGKAVTPLYVQLMEDLEEKIAKGILVPGDRLQSETEMAKTYGVSIITVRNAISSMAEKGMVEKKQGKGTFVTKQKYTRDIKKLQSFTELCNRLGVKAGGRMLENKLVVPDEKTAAMLGIKKGEQAVFISRVRYADNEPVAIESNYFSLKYAFLLGQQFDDNSLFSYMKERSDAYVAMSEKRFELCRATAREAQLLAIRKNDPLLYIKSVTYTRDNEPIYVGTQLVNGERFSFYVYETSNS